MMTESAPNPDTVLRLCAAADPAPWFPSQYAQDTGVDRNGLDDPLNQLRVEGLVRIGGWEAGRGQCYVLTDAGRARLASPRPLPKLLDRAALAVPPMPRPSRLTAWERGEAVRSAFFADSSLRTPVLIAFVAAQVITFCAGLSIVLHRGAPVAEYLKSGLMPPQFAPRQNIPTPLEPLVLDTPDLGQGQWWRLLTYALVHFGVLHLAMNLYGHLALGRLVERMFGSVRFLVLYILSALGGGVAAVLLRPVNVNAVTAGSSGALCGLIGGFAGFVLLNRGHLGRELYDRCRQWLGNTLVVLLLFSFLPSVSWQGHLGGFVAGFVSGVLLTYHRFGTAEQRWAALLGLVLLPIAGLTPLFEKGLMHESPPPAQEDHGEAAIPPEVQRMHFDRMVGIPTERVRLQAIAVSERFVEPLRDERPEARDPQIVRTGREMLAVLRTGQEQTRSQIAKIRPYQLPAIETARQAALTYLAASLAVTAAQDGCLERGRNWNVTKEQADAPGASDELRLQQLANDAMEADLRWRKAARIVISMKPAAPNDRQNRSNPKRRTSANRSAGPARLGGDSGPRPGKLARH
jgi:membrane associated rhomboid family serine protease